MRTTITEDGTDVLIITADYANNAYVFCTTASTLGGGTLTLGIRDQGSPSALIAIDTLIAGDQGQYPIGGFVELHYTLTGATNPVIELMVTQGK